MKILIENVESFLNKEIVLEGWLKNKRDHGNLLFLELRDSTGYVQLVIDNPTNEDKIPLESVLRVKGKVTKRANENINEKETLGHLEIEVSLLNVLSYSANLPFLPEDALNVNEDLCLKYRYLTLRNEEMLKRLKFRAEFIDKIREFMKNNEFLEVQTPILTVSSPEGARDFIVPSRLHKGKFYALPQAPQIFKQLLMVGGINKYFQIAPCFRDEDARKDRCYGEFYQLDFEVSFVEKDDAIIDILTNLMKYVLEFFGKKPIFSVMTYEESMDKYGTDKPNLNNELFLEDFTKVFANSQMDLFRKKIENGEIVKGVRVHGLEKAACDKVLAFTETKGFKTAYVTKINGEIKGPIGKFVSNDICQENETIFFVLNEKNQARKNAGLIIKYFEKKENENFHIVFVKDFPFFEWNAEENKWEFTHNPFSMPKTENLKEENIYAYQYDMVLNGYELASGSVRNYKPNLLIEAFKKCGYLEEDVKKKFCSLINAFQYGVPPHAGAAIGIDRLIMILLNAKNTREVIAFPLNTNGVCPMMNAPSEIDEKLLKDLNIILKK